MRSVLFEMLTVKEARDAKKVAAKIEKKIVVGIPWLPKLPLL